VRIEIDFSAANDPDAHQWLDRILYRIEDGWHVWDTAGQPNPGAIEASTWIRDGGRQGDRVRELLVASVQRDAWTYAPHGRRMRVTACPNASDELTPEDASRLADLPLVILVENRISDGAFVKRVVTELDKSLHRLWQRLNEPIQLDSVGGVGQMLAEVERRSQGRRYRPRLVVIADSDRKGPDDTASPTVRALCRRCEALGVPCWVLAKREADNYLPRVLLDERQDAGADHVRLVEAWDRLNDDHSWLVSGIIPQEFGGHVRSIAALWAPARAARRILSPVPEAGCSSDRFAEPLVLGDVIYRLVRWSQHRTSHARLE